MSVFLNMKTKASRFHHEKVKILFSIKVKDLTMAKDAFKNSKATVTDSPFVSICFERGSKISSSSNKSLDTFQNSNENNINVIFDEVLSLVATMYKDKNTKQYQKKEGKLIVRQAESKNSHKLKTFKGLGLCKLDLSKIANELGYEKSIEYETAIPVKHLREGVLRIMIKASKIDSSPFKSEDEMSDSSFDSDSSCIGATFSFDSEALFGNEDHKSKFLQSPTDYIVDKNSLSTFRDSLRELSNRNSTLNLSSDGGDKNDYGRKSTNINASMDDEYLKQAEELTMQKEQIEKLEERIKGNEDTFSVYQKELENRALRIKRLEMQVTLHSEKASTSRKQLKEVNREVDALKTKYHVQSEKVRELEKILLENGIQAIESITLIDDNLSRLGFVNPQTSGVSKENVTGKQSTVDDTRKLNSNDTHKADNTTESVKSLKKCIDKQTNEIESLKSTIKSNRLELQQAEENNLSMAEDLNRTCAELTEMTEYMMQYKDSAEELEQEREEYMSLIKQASTECVEANYKRSEMEKELNNVIEDLIETKVEKANQALQLEEDRNKTLILRNKMQYYAEKVTAMELLLASATGDEFSDSEDDRESVKKQRPKSRRISNKIEGVVTEEEEVHDNIPDGKEKDLLALTPERMKELSVRGKGKKGQNKPKETANDVIAISKDGSIIRSRDLAHL